MTDSGRWSIARAVASPSCPIACVNKFSACAMNSAEVIPFEAIVEQSVAGIYVIQDDRFVYANSTWAAIAGYAPEELIGMPLSRIVPPDTAMFSPQHRQGTPCR